jgi:acetolactate synthase-1/2/3 large subunit
VAILADVESLAALLFIESNTHESWHNEFKELYKLIRGRDQMRS